MVHAMLFHEGGFLRRADHTNNRATKMLCPLAEDKADTAGRRMDQNSLARLGRVAFFDEEGRGHALQHHRRPLFEADRIRHFHQTIGLDGARLGIGANRASGVSDTVAHLHFRHTFTNGFHNAGRFHADNGGHAGRLIEASAEINIDVIQADRLVPHQGFARLGGGKRHFFPNHFLRTAGFMDADSVIHGGIHQGRFRGAGRLRGS